MTSDKVRVWPGRSFPAGATWDGAGVNFALFAERADAVELCLFGPDGAERRVRMPDYTDQMWHAYLPDVAPGQLYGYRVHGPWEPQKGCRFNPHKVLLDPYARAIGRPMKWSDEMFAYKVGDPAADLSFDDRDNAAFAPLSMVIDPAFTWGDDRRPQTPWHKTIIYELHVKGFSRRNPAVPEDLRGTYGGVASEASIRHLLDLGVTAVELMPVHAKVTDRFLVEKGLTNYWGYSTLGFFAPEPSYAAPNGSLDAVRQFKTMVRTLHAAGIEVILDVVYNHTAEGNQLGPSLFLRGIDNPAYYRLAEDPRHYQDFTGCGNTLNMRHPRVLQLIMDSLRYWVLEMHVDGFRFDLASALARELHEVDRLGAFFDIIHQDPVLSRVKLIAEPWDLGEGGYQVGNFPVLWTEWNGRYRDAVRKFWKGDGGTVNEFATRLAGSSDLYEHSGRRPYASINFITCHDGFTLQDLVSYNDKHNEANGEENRDGTNENYSWNCGAEGPTDDAAIRALRERQKRNLIATLFLSQGVPMISGGDELSGTQQGNNNGYCQDGELTWLDWSLPGERRDFLEFFRSVVRFYKSQPVLQRRRFFHGRSIRGSGIKDIAWLEPSGREMNDEAWNAGFVKCIGFLLSGDESADRDERGQPIRGATLLVFMNAHHEPIPCMLPAGKAGHGWWRVLDTAKPGEGPVAAEIERPYPLEARSMAVFELRDPSPTPAK